MGFHCTVGVAFVFHIYLSYISYFHMLNMFIQGTNSISILFFQFGPVQIKVSTKLFTKKLHSSCKREMKIQMILWEGGISPLSPGSGR